MLPWQLASFWDIERHFHFLIVTVMGPFAICCMYEYTNVFQFLKKFPGERLILISLDLIKTMI